MKNNLYVFFLFFITGLMSCSHHSGLYEHAEKIMSQHPDSVLTLLSTIQDVNDLSEKDRAMYYLLLTEAEDKTYKKHESDSLIAIATEYFDKTDDVKRKAKAWYYRGRVVDDLKDAPRAQDYYLKALQNEMEITDYAFLGRLYNSIGMLYTYQEVYEKAVFYQKKSLRSFELLKDSIGQSFVLRDLGRNFTALSENDSAIFYYERALIIGDKSSKPSIYKELGNLFMNKGDYSKAYECLKSTLCFPLKKTVLDPVNLAFGKLYQKTNKIDSAYYYLNICVASPRLQTRAGAYYFLAELEKDRKHWEEYAKNQIQYEVLRDSMNMIKQTESIRKMERLYDYHQTEAKLLQAKISLEQMKLDNLYMWLLVIASSLLVVFVFVFANIQLKKKRIRLQEHKEKLVALKKKREEDQTRIEENENKIAALEAQLQRSCEAHGEREKELIALRKLKLEAENKSLECVKTENLLLIEKFCVSDIYYRFHVKEEWRPKPEDWKELFKCLDETYDNFTHRLVGVAPKLTTTELRVSCLVKANVPPVTIAMLIVTTPTNVSMIRKRLYEKIHSETGSSEKFDKFIREF